MNHVYLVIIHSASHGDTYYAHESLQDALECANSFEEWEAGKLFITSVEVQTVAFWPHVSDELPF